MNNLSNRPRRQLWLFASGFGLLNILIHISFLFRYDLYFQSDIAVCHLMAKQIMRGDFSIYNWGADYGGIGPVDFLTALLFKIFGASIPLAGFVSLMFWAFGVTLVTAFVGAYVNRRAMIAAGTALAVSMPHMLMYSTQPLSSTYPQAVAYIGGFIWLAVIMVERGVTSKLPIFVGLLMGWFWYSHKQVVVVWAAIGLSLLAMEQGRAYLKSFVRSKIAIFTVVAFLIGYSPEILYKAGLISHEGRFPDTSRFLKVAPPDLMAKNWYMIFRCIPTYVNADPLSRSHSSVHYLNHLENWESFPQQPTDIVGIIAACLIIGFILHMVVKTYREKNLPLFLLAMLPLVDVGIIVLSAKAEGSYYSIRRYLLPAGIVGLIWLGIRLADDWEAKRRVRAGILGFTVLLSFLSQRAMLEIPDQLVDYKETAKQIEQDGYKYGLSWFSQSHTLTALTDERVSFGIIDRRFDCPYQLPATTASEVAIVWQATSPPPYELAQNLLLGGVRIPGSGPQVLPEKINIFGYEYSRLKQPKIVGELGWAPYRKGALAAARVP